MTEVGRAETAGKVRAGQAWKQRKSYNKNLVMGQVEKQPKAKLDVGGYEESFIGKLEKPSFV